MKRKLNKRYKVITTIFFDVGGVLSVDFIETKVKDLAEKYKKDYNLLMEAKKRYRPLTDLGQISEPEFWIKVLKYVNVQATEDDWKFDWYIEKVDGGIEIAKKLKQNGYRIAILSNDSKECSEQRRRIHGFDDLFHDIIISSYFGFIKPELKIFELALKRLNVSPDQSIFIDDRLENIKASEQIGIYSILFQNVDQVNGELIKLGLKG